MQRVRSESLRMWLTPQEVGNMTGFSASFIRTEIQGHQLPAQFVRSKSGLAGRWRIHRDDAIAYTIRLGLWRDKQALPTT